jgi:hypothetical protein
MEIKIKCELIGMLNTTPSNSKFILLNMGFGKELTQTKNPLQSQVSEKKNQMFLEKGKGNLALETNVAMFLSTNALNITSFLVNWFHTKPNSNTIHA